MFVEERHNAIKRLVRSRRRISFVDLQREIDVSPATLRRDLAELQELGELIRVHGGVLDPSYVRAEISLEERVLNRSQEKRIMAGLAATLIPPGATVLVDAGSSCLEAGVALLGRRDVRIITHSVPLLTEALRGQAEVLAIGGDLRHVSGALTGGGALGALANIHADYALIGASGLDLELGLSTTELSEAEMKTAFVARSTTRVLLADSSKWRHPSTVKFAAWSDFHYWVTDSAQAGAELKKACPKPPQILAPGSSPK